MKWSLHVVFRIIIFLGLDNDFLELISTMESVKRSIRHSITLADTHVEH